MLRLLKPPTLEPVGLEEIKAHGRFDYTHEDDYLLTLIKAAREWVENYLNSSLLYQTWQKVWHQDLGLLPVKKPVIEISLPKPPLVEVVSVCQILTDNTEKAIKRYMIDTTRCLPKLVLASYFQTVQVTYTTGYGKKPGEVPEAIRQAIRMLVFELYEKRGGGDLNPSHIIYSFLQPFRQIGC